MANVETELCLGHGDRGHSQHKEEETTVFSEGSLVEMLL